MRADAALGLRRSEARGEGELLRLHGAAPAGDDAGPLHAERFRLLLRVSLPSVCCKCEADDRVTSPYFESLQSRTQSVLSQQELHFEALSTDVHCLTHQHHRALGGDSKKGTPFGLICESSPASVMFACIVLQSKWTIALVQARVKTPGAVSVQSLSFGSPKS